MSGVGPFNPAQNAGKGASDNSLAVNKKKFEEAMKKVSEKEKDEEQKSKKRKPTQEEESQLQTKQDLKQEPSDLPLPSLFILAPPPQSGLSETPDTAISKSKESAFVPKAPLQGPPPAPKPPLQGAPPPPQPPTQGPPPPAQPPQGASESNPLPTMPLDFEAEDTLSFDRSSLNQDATQQNAPSQPTHVKETEKQKALLETKASHLMKAEHEIQTAPGMKATLKPQTPSVKDSEAKKTHGAKGHEKHKLIPAEAHHEIQPQKKSSKDIPREHKKDVKGDKEFIKKEKKATDTLEQKAQMLVQEAGQVLAPMALAPLPPSEPILKASFLSKEVHELFQTLVGLVMVKQLSKEGGLMTTTEVSLNNPEYQNSKFYGLKIVITEYETAKGSFNIELQGNSVQNTLLQKESLKLISAFKDNRYNLPFTINRLEISVKKDEDFLFKRKESVKGGQKDMHDNKGK